MTTGRRERILRDRGYVEPVVPPPEPQHIVAQQLLALCLQEHRVGEHLWPRWWEDLAPFGPSARPIVRHLAEEGFVDVDGAAAALAEPTHLIMT